MAHKKAGGSSRNGRDSDGRRLGVKKFGGERVARRQHSRASARHEIPRRPQCRHGHGSYAVRHRRRRGLFRDERRRSPICNGTNSTNSSRIRRGSDENPAPATSPADVLETHRTSFEMRVKGETPFHPSGKPRLTKGMRPPRLLLRLRPPRLAASMFPDLARDDVFRLETARLWLRWPRVRPTTRRSIGSAACGTSPAGPRAYPTPIRPGRPSVSSTPRGKPTLRAAT